jgi:hypothetical protein
LFDFYNQSDHQTSTVFSSCISSEHTPQINTVSYKVYILSVQTHVHKNKTLHIKIQLLPLIFVYGWAEKETDGQTNGATNRQTDRPTGRQTNRLTDNLTDQQSDRRTLIQIDRRTDRQSRPKVLHRYTHIPGYLFADLHVYIHKNEKLYLFHERNETIVYSSF